MNDKWILCMFSGGLDSAGALYTLLTNPEYNDYKIHVHFIEMLNKERRFQQERQAVAGCIKWFENHCRSFEFTKSVQDFSFMTHSYPFDSDVYIFVASQIISSSKLNYTGIALGVNRDDFRTDAPNRFIRSYAIRDACFTGLKKQIPEKIYPVQHLTKQQIWDILPKPVRLQTWSCRTPQNGNPCGRCKPCEERNEIV